jgi:hypothetical protein
MSHAKTSAQHTSPTAVTVFILNKLDALKERIYMKSVKDFGGESSY